MAMAATAAAIKTPLASVPAAIPPRKPDDKKIPAQSPTSASTASTEKDAAINQNFTGVENLAKKRGSSCPAQLRQPTPLEKVQENISEFESAHSTSGQSASET
eukprot:6482967-Amphidinium_carterae.1